MLSIDHAHAFDYDDLVDADDDNEHQLQASSRTSVSSEACDRVPPCGKEGSKKGQHPVNF